MLFSFVITSESNHFYNRSENSRINLLNSNISSTVIEIEVDEYKLDEQLIPYNTYQSCEKNGPYLKETIKAGNIEKIVAGPAITGSITLQIKRGNIQNKL